MKTRESGMPDEEMWEGFFQPEFVLRQLGLTAQVGDVVDFGCGYGTFTVAAARIVRGTVHAVDIEPGMVAATAAKAQAAGLSNVEVSTQDFVTEGTGLPDASVAYAMLFNILHAEQPEVLLREAWRVLVPGGLLGIMHWNHDASTPRGPSLSIRPRPEECRAWAEAVGFRAVTDKPVPLPPYHYGWILERPAHIGRATAARTGVSRPGRPLPLFDHPLEAPTAFRPEDLIEAVLSKGNRPGKQVPELCVLEFDGELTDKLTERDELTRWESWPCFHTTMWLYDSDGFDCGIIPRTIGGPYAVLVAEQLAVCGAKLIVGLASAGRVSPALPLPGIVLADGAIRDEGTSYHYLPASETVEASAGALPFFWSALGEVGLPLQQDLVWTTDAPYRETQDQMKRYADMGALAVEMQAASLFAFGKRQGVEVALVAHVTNAPDYDGEPFDKGPADADVLLLQAICRAGRDWLVSR